MNLNNLSAKRKFVDWLVLAWFFSMLVITGIFGGIMQDIREFL